MSKKRTIRDARAEMSSCDFRLMSLAIMGKTNHPDFVDEVASLEAKLEALETEYPGRLRQTAPEFREKK